MLITLVFVTVIGFALIELPPGSYLEFRIQELRRQRGNLTIDRIQALEKRYGVNDPLPVRFWKWIRGFVRGDFGQSFQYDRPVGELLWGRLGFTVLISFLTLVFSWSVAIVIGVYSATHRYTIPDYIITAFQFAALSIPNFLLALILMVFLQQQFGLHVSGLYSQAYRDVPWSVAKLWDLIKHLSVPIAVLGFSSTAWTSGLMSPVNSAISWRSRRLSMP